jgi:DNA-binding response OmpR family regulator
MRILIADNDEPRLGIMQSYLWDHGHEAEIAADGLECIAILQEFVPDALVLDQELLWGGCDGVMAQVGDDPLLCQIPVILVVDEREKFYSSAHPRVVAWLKKPFRLSDLLGHITSLSRMASSAGQRLGATQDRRDLPEWHAGRHFVEDQAEQSNADTVQDRLAYDVRRPGQCIKQR